MYVISGSDESLKQRYTSAIIKKCAPNKDDSFNFQRFDAQKASMEEVTDAVMALPVFAPTKCVVLTGANLDAMAESEYKKLKETAEDCPPKLFL